MDKAARRKTGVQNGRRLASLSMASALLLLIQLHSQIQSTDADPTGVRADDFDSKTPMTNNMLHSADTIQELVQQEYMHHQRHHHVNTDHSKNQDTPVQNIPDSERDQALFDLELGIFASLSQRQANDTQDLRLSDGFNFCSRDPDTPITQSELCSGRALVTQSSVWDYEFQQDMDEIVVLYFVPEAGRVITDYSFFVTSTNQDLLPDSGISYSNETNFDDLPDLRFYNLTTLCTYSNSVGVTNITWVAVSSTARFEFLLQVYVVGMTFTGMSPILGTVDATSITFPTYLSTTNTSDVTVLFELQAVSSTMGPNQALSIADLQIDVSLTDYYDQFTWRSNCPVVSAQHISDTEARLPNNTNCGFGFDNLEELLAIRFNPWRTGPNNQLTILLTFAQSVEINYVSTVYTKELVIKWLSPAPPFYFSFQPNDTMFSYNGGQVVTMKGYNFFPTDRTLFYLTQLAIVWGVKNMTTDTGAYDATFVSTCNFVTSPGEGENLDYLVTAVNRNSGTARLFLNLNPLAPPFIVNYGTYVPPPDGNGNDVFESVTFVVGFVDTELASVLEDTDALLSSFANAGGVPLNQSRMSNATTTRFASVGSSRRMVLVAELGVRATKVHNRLDLGTNQIGIRQREVLQGVRGTYVFSVLKGLELTTKQDLEAYVTSGRGSQETGYNLVLVDVNYVVPEEQFSSTASDVAIAVTSTGVAVVIVAAVSAQVASVLSAVSNATAQVSAIAAATTSGGLVPGAGTTSAGASHAIVGVEGQTPVGSSAITGKPSSAYTIHALQYCAALCQINSTGITEPMLSTCTELSFANLQVSIPFLTSKPAPEYIEVEPDSTTARMVGRTSAVSQYFMQFPQSELVSRDVESFYDLQQSNLTSVFQSQLFLIAILVSGVITLHVTCYVFTSRYRRMRNVMMDIFPKFEIILLNIIHMGVYLGGFAVITSNDSQPAGLVVAAVFILFIFGLGYPLFLLLVCYKVVAPNMNRTWLSNYVKRHLARGGWRCFRKLEKQEEEEIQRSWLAKDAEDPSQNYWYLETSNNLRFSGKWCGGVTNKWARRFGEIFEQFRGQYFWYYLAEVTIVSIEGIIIGAFGEQGDVQAAILVTLASIDLLLCIWLLPFNDVLELIIQLLVSGINLAVSILVLVSLNLDGNSGINLSRAMVYLLLAAIILTAVYILYATVEAIVIYRRQIADTMKRCWMVMRGQELSEDESESDEEESDDAKKSTSDKSGENGNGAVADVGSEASGGEIQRAPGSGSTLDASLLYGDSSNGGTAVPSADVSRVQTIGTAFDASGRSMAPPRPMTVIDDVLKYNSRSSVGLPAEDADESQAQPPVQ